MGRTPKKALAPIDADHQKIGNQLAKLRKARGLTQLQLAEKIGLARSSIADIERGENRIYDVMLIRIANALEVTPNDILGFAKNHVTENIQVSLRLMKRIKKIEQLPASQQKALLKTIDLALQSAQKEK